MADVWDKLDAYTKSDYLNSSDDDGDLVNVLRKAETKAIKSETTDTQSQNNECSESNGVVDSENVHENLLKEMRENELHQNTESRNIQEKLDDITAMKDNQKAELSEMQHKAQVISKGARQSANEVLSSIITSDTMDIEENPQMSDVLERIRTANTCEKISDSDAMKMECDNDKSSDIDLPDIQSTSTNMLNTGIMKSKVNVARQGSMKTRRKPTKRKSWLQDIEKLDEVDGTKMETNESDNLATITQADDTGITGKMTQKYGSQTSTTDSSSEEEQESTKPHLKSSVALPGLWDAEKMKMQRSELKRPTASNLVKTAKDAKENEVTREDKTEVVSPKPAWMAEVEQRRKQPKPARRKHVTLPARCSELDKLFEQRDKDRDATGVRQNNQNVRSTQSDNNRIDPQLSKLLEKRRNLAPMETPQSSDSQTPQRPKSLVNFAEVSELDRVFEKRKSLQPLESVVSPVSSQSDSDDKTTFVRNGKLEPLSGEIKVATITDISATRNHQEKPVNQVSQFIEDGDSGEIQQISRNHHRRHQSPDKTPARKHVHPTSPGENVPSDRHRTPGKNQTQAGQVAEFVFDGKDGRRAIVGKIPTPPTNHVPASKHFQPTSPSQEVPSSNHRVPAKNHSRPPQPSQTTQITSKNGTQESQVVQFAFDGKGGSHAMVGRIPSPPTERPVSRLGQNKEHRPVMVKGKDETQGGHVVVQSRSIQNDHPTPKTIRAFNNGGQHQPKTPVYSSTPPPQPRSDPGVSRSRPVSRLDDSHGKSQNNGYHRLSSTDQPKHIISNMKRTSADFNSKNPDSNTDPGGFKTYTKSDHSPRIPPLTHSRPMNNTPHVTNQVNRRNLDKRSERSYNSSNNDHRPLPVTVTSPVLTHKSTVTTTEVNRLNVIACDSNTNHVKNSINIHNGNKVRQNGAGVRNLSDNCPRPVMVKAKSVTDTPVHVQNINRNSVAIVARKGNTLSPITNSKVPRHRSEGRMVISNTESTDCRSGNTQEIPKWQQELREKRISKGDRQKITNHDKENIKTASPENDVAEWQKRLKGIRQKWGDESHEKKENNDRSPGRTETDIENNNSEVPAFLKEFQAKKTKQKLVTVTASSINDSDKEKSTESDKSKKQNQGTYV